MRALIVSFLFVFLALNLSAQETAPVSPETKPSVETQSMSETAPTTQQAPETAPVSETLPVSQPETTVTEKNPPATGDFKKIDYAAGTTCEAEGVEVRPEGYTLRLSFLEGGSESVCGLEVKIKTVKGKSVFQLKTVVSPWLYLDLPAGGYIVWAKAKEGEPVIITTQTAAGRLQRARLFFK
jgi:hypothetical protein